MWKVLLFHRVLEKRLRLLEDRFSQHVDDCMSTRAEILTRFDQQADQVKRLHGENQASTNSLVDAVHRLEGSTGTFDAMLPAIKAGVEEAARRDYRRKLLGRIAASVLATLLTVSGLIPLAQVLLGLHITFSF